MSGVDRSGDLDGQSVVRQPPIHVFVYFRRNHKA